MVQNHFILGNREGIPVQNNCPLPTANNACSATTVQYSEPQILPLAKCWEIIIIAKMQSQVLVSGLIGFRNETWVLRASVTRRNLDISSVLHGFNPGILL
jgi:hypothetical protein